MNELQALDPYDFSLKGYRCTVTIARLVPGAPWWFASCNRCSKTCAPDGIGYRCTQWSCTGFRFKYRLSFIATDGTAEAEMIAFGDIGHRIVGKPVQAVLRDAKYSTEVPPDIAAIVCLRFTFSVTLTEQSFYKETKSYQVNTIVTSYGRQPAVPQLIAPDPPAVLQNANPNAQVPSQVFVQGTPPAALTEALAGSSSAQLLSHGPATDVPDATHLHTPPPQHITETPEKTSASVADSISSKPSKARKTFDSTNTDIEADKLLAGEPTDPLPQAGTMRSAPFAPHGADMKSGRGKKTK
ncbi:hypothetical protein ACP4OV_002198 [Aristida adscensionis]